MKTLIYLPFEKAEEYAIPTEKQWFELDRLCRWEYQRIWSPVEKRYCVIFNCIGPNGNIITFDGAGFTKAHGLENLGQVFFWISDTTEDINKIAVHIFRIDDNIGIREGRSMEKMFSGYKLPIRLIKKV